jgi:hypothetical protein
LCFAQKNFCAFAPRAKVCYTGFIPKGERQAALCAAAGSRDPENQQRSKSAGKIKWPKKMK